MKNKSAFWLFLIGLGSQTQFHFVGSLGYWEFVALKNRAIFVLTDSGGVQEEASSIGKPILVLRDTTERPEAVEAGGVRLVGADAEKICDGVRDLLTNDQSFTAMAQARSPYGDGNAADRIVSVLQKP